MRFVKDCVRLFLTFGKATKDGIKMLDVGFYNMEGSGKMRENLKRARKDAGLTQQQVADKLEIGLRYYKSLESGERLGGIELLDALEDLFKIHQRKLREISKNCPDQEDNQ